MGLFDKLFGGGKGAGQGDGGSQPPNAADPLEAASRETHDRLTAFWSSVGALESDVIAHLISPQLLGGAAWPTTRQAYRVVRRPSGVLLATDGLSEPVQGPEGPRQGVGVELFLETPDLPPELQGHGDVSKLGGTWAYEILSQAAALVADNPNFTDILDRYGIISTEFPGVSGSHHVASQLPPEFITDRDSVGALIGGPSPDFPTVVEGPLGPIRIVPLVLVLAADIDQVVAAGPDGRQALAERLGRPVSRLG